MPVDPIPSSDARKRSGLVRAPLPEDAEPEEITEVEADFARLAALFAERSGGRYSEQFSAEMACEIVLNEIAEQACRTTGASGAAIVLRRNEEMVCRASSGTPAPEAGARIDHKVGMSKESMLSRQLRRCDDTQSDPRPDVAAWLRVGVRSVMLLPLQRDGEVVGMFELFSSVAAAFGERDERTLKALGQRVIRSLERVAKPADMAAGSIPGTHPLQSFQSTVSAIGISTSTEDGVEGGNLEEDRFRKENHTLDGGVQQGVDLVTWILGLTVLACAVFLGVRAADRFGWLKARPAVHRASANASAFKAAAGAGRQEEPGPNVQGASATTAFGSKPASEKSNIENSGGKEAELPEGGLRVYENGLEVFHMNPGSEQSPERSSKQIQFGGRSTVVQASSVGPESEKLSPEVAAGSLLYRVEPEYPAAARAAGIEGPVVLAVHIGPDGSVKELKQLSGSVVLGQAAMEAVKNWRFKPHAINGQPSEMETTIKLNFKMQR